tara:strand:- start:60 stop:557 length:498 start_codon:yes stop_codon:yes gene_type:complete
MSEEFVSIPSYEGLYQINKKGDVKSLERISIQNHKLNERILKSGVSSNGYLTVVLHKKKTRKTFPVHQLVAISFLGHEPSGYDVVVDHINNNPLDNRVENLQLTTARHNSSKNRTGSSHYTGVSWHKRDEVWNASIVINGKKKHLGSFTDELEANQAYQNKLKQI